MTNTTCAMFAMSCAGLPGTAMARREHLGRGLRGGEDGNYLELDQVRPRGHPLIEQRAVGALHHLIAMAKVGADPTAYVLEPFRRETTALAEALVHRARLTLTKVLDDHVQHVDLRNR